MKYTKCLECDFCGDQELSNSKLTFERLTRKIGWLFKYDNKNKDYQFCSRKCFNNYVSEENLKFSNFKNEKPKTKS